MLRVVAVDEDGTLNKPSMGALYVFAPSYSAAETVFCGSTCTLNILLNLCCIKMFSEHHFINYSTNISIFKLFEVPRNHKEVLISDFRSLFTLHLHTMFPVTVSQKQRDKSDLPAEQCQCEAAAGCGINR